MSATVINAILLAFVPVVNNFMTWYKQVKAESERTKEWTEEEKEANQAAIKKLGINPEEWEKVQPL